MVDVEDASEQQSNEDLGGAEVTVCLRKLLEAKDCAVRAKLNTINDGLPIPPDE